MAGSAAVAGGLAIALTAIRLAAAAPPVTSPARPATGVKPSPLSVIGPGDMLTLFVWKEAELSRDVLVRLDGKITVPLLGEVQAAGRAPQELAADIERDLKKFLAAPSVTLGISQATSARFYVIGQVQKAGEFPLTGRITVLQALAIAGGFKEYAKTEDIVIIRQEGAEQTTIPVNYKRLETGKGLSQNVGLQPGDTVVVP